MRLLIFSAVLRVFYSFGSYPVSMIPDPFVFPERPYFAGSGTCSDTPKPVMLPTTRVE